MHVSVLEVVVDRMPYRVTKRKNSMGNSMRKSVTKKRDMERIKAELRHWCLCYKSLYLSWDLELRALSIEVHR